jgi:hypothetical protein
LLPKTIKIGPVTYTVLEVESLGENPAETQEIAGQTIVTKPAEIILGDVSYDQETIRIVESNGPQHRAIHLMHEIIHAVLYQAGKISEQADESLVVALSYGLTDLIRDNPELVALLWNNPEISQWQRGFERVEIVHTPGESYREFLDKLSVDNTNGNPKE